MRRFFEPPAYTRLRRGKQARRYNAIEITAALAGKTNSRLAA
jgi:hypothetical protein